jgi:hypothetical protein
MSDTMNDPNKNDPNEGALAPTVAEAVDLNTVSTASCASVEKWQRSWSRD